MVTGAPLRTNIVTVVRQKADGDRGRSRSAQRHMYKTGILNSPITLSNFAFIMKSLDEPPFLPVGTDVSAKYRGAFCEAKIKSTKRLVKVKVTFQKDATTVEIQDDHVKGPLKIGAMVEIKMPDGTYQEAVVNKLTDASWYTVVFDDGDEKTLRRSSLCLKGERHFAESQTLDQLPLTNPEHFGTPVIRKKNSRRRRFNRIPEDASSTSSSDADDESDKTRDMFLGKVVCVSLNTEGKKKTWIPALVVSPEYRDDISVKKDFIFVRSFKDGKFFSVVKSDIQDIGELSLECDCVLKPAYDHALEFIRSKAIPTNWKAELKEESSSSETENEDDETRDDQKIGGREHEEEVEPFPDEGENFLQQLYKFMEDRGTPINKRPVLGYRNLNLFKLFRLVHQLGGFNNIESGAVWKQVYQDLGIPVLNSAAGYNVKCAYKKYLYGFEEYCSSTNICFHMDMPKKLANSSKDSNLENKNLEKQDIKSVENIKEDVTVKNDHCDKSESNKEEVHNLETEISASCLCEEEPKGPYENLLDKDVLKESESNQEQNEDINTKIKEITSFLGSSDEAEEKTGEKVKNNEDETFEIYPPSIKPHVQYDEWMKADKTIRPADKSVPKIKHRRKIKNKCEGGHKRTMLSKDENSSKQCKLFSRPLFQSCDLDKNTCFDCNCRNSAQDLLKPLEIASILNGLQATENSEDGIEVDHKMNKNENDFKCDWAPRAEGNCSQGTQGIDFRTDKKTVCKEKQEESSDETDYEEEAPRRKKFVNNFDKSKSHNRYGKRKYTSCGKGLIASINDENISCKKTFDRFDAEIMSSDEEVEQPKAKVPLLQQCNGLDDKKQKLQTARLYSSLQDISDKKTKTNYSEERLKAKDPKDVWSSIQGQWPKKILKELFSDSDTEGASSPHHIDLEDPPTDSTFQPVSNETRDLSVEFLKPVTHTIEIKPTDEKMGELDKNKVDFPSSGSNSVLNTPPTTPESSSSREFRRPQLTLQILKTVDVNQEDIESTKTESNRTELESVTCELQDLQFEGNLSLTGFDVSIISSSNNHLSVESQEKDKKKGVNYSSHVENCTERILKQNHKSPLNIKRKIVNTSDSEDLSGGESHAKIHSSKSFPEVPSKLGKTSSTMSSPEKYMEQEDKESGQKEYSDHLPKVYKWSFHLSDLENMTSEERIAFLQQKLEALRKHYLSLKSEVASIDRKRKHSKKKEREGAVLSTISSSPSSNSVTAAVMLTLAEPSLSASSQNAMEVECR